MQLFHLFNANLRKTTLLEAYQMSDLNDYYLFHFTIDQTLHPALPVILHKIDILAYDPDDLFGFGFHVQEYATERKFYLRPITDVFLYPKEVLTLEQKLEQMIIYAQSHIRGAKSVHLTEFRGETLVIVRREQDFMAFKYEQPMIRKHYDTGATAELALARLIYSLGKKSRIAIILQDRLDEKTEQAILEVVNTYRKRGIQLSTYFGRSDCEIMLLDNRGLGQVIKGDRVKNAEQAQGLCQTLFEYAVKLNLHKRQLD